MHARGQILVTSRWPTRLLFSIALCLSGSACVQESPRNSPLSSPEVGRPAAEGALASLLNAPTEWPDEQGSLRTLAEFRGTPVVVAPFFTSCVARCPITVQKLQELDAAFVEAHAPLQVLLVTLTPRSDTRDRLLAYKSAHHLGASWHLLRGSDTATRALARQLGLRMIEDDEEVDHDVRIVLFDANGHVARAYDGWRFDIADALHSVTR